MIQRAKVGWNMCWPVPASATGSNSGSTGRVDERGDGMSASLFYDCRRILPSMRSGFVEFISVNARLIYSVVFTVMTSGFLNSPGLLPRYT